MCPEHVEGRRLSTETTSGTGWRVTATWHRIRRWAPNWTFRRGFYGPLIDTTVRIVTWNVWGLYGPWEQREAAIAAILAKAGPDVVVLTESWSKGTDSQCARLARLLDLPHHAFSGVPAQEDRAALSGVAIMSRWPISRQSSHTFADLRVHYAEVSGPRGPIQVYGVVMDAWWFDQSQPRQNSVRELLTHVDERQDDRVPLVVCGDFNADPDSDEIRMLRGRSSAPVPGLSFYDAWEVAGGPGQGCTWSNDNPWATALLAGPPDRLHLHRRSATRRGGPPGQCEPPRHPSDPQHSAVGPLRSSSRRSVLTGNKLRSACRRSASSGLGTRR